MNEKLTKFTFSDTGITIVIRKVSPMLINDINSALPMPEPPKQEVDYGEPRGKVMEANYSDPGYRAKVAKHNENVSDLYNRLLITRAVVEIEDEDWEDKVTQYREFIKDKTGSDLPEPEDKLVYVISIASGTTEGLIELIEAITRRSQPTEEVVEDAKDKFRS